MLSVLVGIILVLMLGTSAIDAQDTSVANQLKVTNKPTIELLTSNITKDESQYKLIGQLKNTMDETVSIVMINAIFFDEY